MRILVVDDEEIKRVTLADDLGAQGHEVVTANASPRVASTSRRAAPVKPEAEGLAMRRSRRISGQG